MKYSNYEWCLFNIIYDLYQSHYGCLSSITQIFLFEKRFTLIRIIVRENVGKYIYKVEIMYFRINFMNVTMLSLYLSIYALCKLFFDVS